jgi:putative ABC transport system permease protein
MFDSVWQDVRYGARSLRKHPTPAVVSALTLALAIGVNSAIFSLVSVVAFADLPMSEPDRVGFVWMADANTGNSRVSVSHQDLMDLRENSSFESLAGLMRGAAILSGDGDPARIEAGFVTDNLWDAWQVPMAIGRGFADGEDLPDASPVVLLSYGFWQEEYAGSPDVLGKTLRIDGHARTVVGVVPRIMELGNLARASVWLPLGEPRTGGDREARRLLVSGRLLPGVSHAQANEEMAAIGSRLAEQYPETNATYGVRVMETKDSLVGENLPVIFLLMTLSVGFVLLIACANVASILLAKAMGRTREFAMRAALGAGTLRVIRQLLTESLLISLAAGLMGLGLAQGMIRLMVVITRGREVLFTMATLDREVLIFTLLVTMLAPLLFGILPALRASRGDVNAALKEGGARSGIGHRAGRVRGVLVVSQISLALVLMILAGVAARTVRAIQTLDPGYETANVLSMVVELPEGDYPDEESVRLFFGELASTASAIPDEDGVALVGARPGFAMERSFEIEGRPVVDERDHPRAARTVASAGYLSVMRIPLLQGRAFSFTDNEESPPVGIVSREAVERYWPGENPIGKRLRFGEESQAWIQIVGVAGGTEFSSSGRSLERVPQIYLPAAQRPLRRMTLLVRTRSEPTLAVAASRSAVWAVDPNQPVDDVRSMDQYVYDAGSSDLALVTLFSTFALFALAMAAMGIYGVMSYLVSEQGPEISVRMALGAEKGDVLRMILLRGSRLLLIGTCIGLVGALFMSRILASVVVGVSERDPLTFIGVPLVLILVGLIANYIPAFRATRMDPMKVMRTE